MQKALDKVKKAYSFWGNFPLLYAAQDYFTFMGRPQFIRKRAAEKLHAKKGGRVLEVACGNGRNFPHMMKAIGKEGRLLGFDYSREMLDYGGKFCMEKGWNNVKLVQGDAAVLRIGENDFDGVLSVLGISAIPDWGKALKRCHEVLKPGGRLSVCDARLFRGWLKFLNPFAKSIYSKYAAWDSSKNIPEKMKEIFGNVEVEDFNVGTMFIAVSTKEK